MSSHLVEIKTTSHCFKMPNLYEKLSQFSAVAVLFFLRGGEDCSTTFTYDYTLTFGGDGIFDPTPNATFFLEHHLDAGFSMADIIIEGKNAAAYFLTTYGIDATGLADSVYLAPNEDLPKRVTFTYVTISPELNFKLITGSIANRAQFFNLPVSAVWYTLNFARRFRSTGTFNGVIPAGSTIVFGSYFIKACHKSILGGDIFIRFKCSPTRLYSVPEDADPFLPFDCDLTHELWGPGKLRGLFVFTDVVNSIASGREVLTFSKSV